MNRIYALLAVCFIALFGVSASAVQPYPVPTLQFRTLDGKEIGPKELEGKVVLLDFWATWCGYCARARPEVEAIAKRHAAAPFTRISISADESEATLRKFLAAHPAHPHQVWDGDRQLLSRFRVSGFPTHLLINPSGQVVHVMNGWGADSGAGLDRAITAELGKVAAAAPRAKI